MVVLCVLNKDPGGQRKISFFGFNRSRINQSDWVCFYEPAPMVPFDKIVIPENQSLAQIHRYLYNRWL